MKGELEKYGLQLPSFSKIGGILAKELSVDEAAGTVCADRCLIHGICCSPLPHVNPASPLQCMLPSWLSTKR